MQELKLIVAGGRDFNDYELLSTTVMYLANRVYQASQVSIVCGMARGADMLGHHFATEHDVKVYEFPANWSGLGKRAGFMRNTEMGKFADSLVVFWDGKSHGTKHMMDFMTQLGKPVHVVKY